MRILTLIFICGTLTACGKAPHPQTLQMNREGSALLKQQSFQGALDKFIESLRYDPFQPELHLNMGLAFEALEQPEKALQSYAQAEKWAANPATKFMALFNQAQLLAKGKKVDEALALYQKALEVIPTSKEAKTNIELLTQSQQQQGGGEGEDQKNQDNQDQKQDPNKKDQNKDGQDKKDKKDSGQDGKDDKQDKKKDEDKQYKGSPKYQPRKFEGKDLSESDVKKILGELRQQEQKIRAEFNRKEVKEQPRDKDW